MWFPFWGNLEKGDWQIFLWCMACPYRLQLATSCILHLHTLFQRFRSCKLCFYVLHTCYATASCGFTHSLLSSHPYLLPTTCSLCWAYTGTGTFDIMTITVSFRSYVVLCVIDSVYVCLYTHKVFASTIQPLAYFINDTWLLHFTDVKIWLLIYWTSLISG